MLAARASLEVETGLLEWLAAGLWVAVLGLLVRGLTAKRRMQSDMRESRTRALAVLESTHALPVLSDIILFVGRRVDWGIKRTLLGQPEDRIPVEVAHAELAHPRRQLAAICADAADLDRLQDEVVGAARRQALWCIPFLAAWAYLVFWAFQKGLQMPVPLTACCFGLACAAGGAIVAERLAEMRASEKFADLERRYEAGLLK